MNVAANITVTPERLEEYRQGYRCLMCHAAQESAFPERCIEWYCRYPIRKRQSGDFTLEFEGEYDPWPTHREEPEPDPSPGWSTTGSGIVVPKEIQ